MIVYCGEVYPIKKEIFEQKYTAIDERYVSEYEYEYEPSIINISDGKSYNLMKYARKCMSL